VSAPKDRREIELIVAALDDELPDDAEGQEAVRRLGIDVKSWAASIEGRIASARAEARKRRFELAATDYQRDLEALGQRRPERRRSKDEQQRILKELIARAPRSTVASVHFHKFEQATEDELGEMIRTLRHLLGEDDE
jgi:hypothetical protein